MKQFPSSKIHLLVESKLSVLIDMNVIITVNNLYTLGCKNTGIIIITTSIVEFALKWFLKSYFREIAGDHITEKLMLSIKVTLE